MVVLGIQSKIVSIVGVMILVVILFSTLFISRDVETLSKKLSLEVAEETAQRNGLEVKRLLELALEEAKVLEAAFWQLRNAKVDRKVLDRILHDNTAMNKKLLGSWMLWEPNVYDGQDDKYKGTEGHDHTGRVNSFWHWQDNEIVHEVSIDWQTSGWYQNPKKRMKETLEDPYFYSVSGEELLLISSIQPIVHDERFYGVIGVDLKLEIIQNLVSSLQVLESGYSALVANNGMYVAHPQKNRIGKFIHEFEGETLGLDHLKNLDLSNIKAKYDDVIEASAYHLMVSIDVGNTDSSWVLMVTLPAERILAPAEKIHNEILLTAIFSGALMLLLLTVVVRKLLTPVINMTEILETQFDAKLGIFPQFKIDSNDEFGNLASSFNQMSLEINHSRAQLEQLNIELSVFNEQLEQRVIQKTHKLLESEKMASIGRLITGVSHELNTPVGICVTALSYLQDQLNSDSDATVDEIKQSLTFLSENLNKVSALINSFKLLSVSSSMEEKVTFSCKDLINVTTRSVETQLNVTDIDIDIVGDDASIHSLPTALSQVIHHIVSNSIVHGFQTKSGDFTNARIMISMDISESEVTIECSDNGIGMDEEMTHKIFEAFSTQRLGQGGTGLGMNIVYNIVTQVLSGSIECQSQLGQGTLYRIQFPR